MSGPRQGFDGHDQADGEKTIANDEQHTDAPARPARVELVGLGRRFGTTTAVESIDLNVLPGEFVTLLGSSGSGKTTTLAMIAGFQKPTAGRILIDGIDVTRLAPNQRNIGVVFQNYSLFPHMTVWDNVAFPLRRRGWSRDNIRERVFRVLATVQLDNLAERYPRQLSGGQQQRVALARATVFRPPLLLMDEPLSALDKGLRETMQTEIRRIHQDLGTTVIYVTHDQEEALAMSDRIVLMDAGRVAQGGAPREIYDRPNSAFVARFLGDSNFLRGRVTKSNAPITEVLLSDGTSVRGHAAKTFDAGDAVWVMVRPENMIVDANGIGTDLCGVEASVEQIAYLGRSLRLEGRFATGEPCLLRVPTAENAGLTTHSRIRLAWRTDQARVLPFS